MHDMHGTMISMELPGSKGWGKSFEKILPVITTEVLKVIHAPHPYRVVAEIKISNFDMLDAFGNFYAKEIAEGRSVLEPVRGMAVEIKKGVHGETDDLFLSLVTFTDIRSLQLFMEILYGIFPFKTQHDLQLSIYGIDKKEFDEN